MSYAYKIFIQNVSNYDKVRIIALYVMIKNGISEENLTKLFTHAQLSAKDQDMVRNLSYLGINVIADSRKKLYSVPRKERITESTYQMSRWTPVIKDIMEDCIEDKLDLRNFPFLKAEHKILITTRQRVLDTATGIKTKARHKSKMFPDLSYLLLAV
nr:protein ROP-like [Drosophila bipectinata]